MTKTNLILKEGYMQYDTRRNGKIVVSSKSGTDNENEKEITPMEFFLSEESTEGEKKLMPVDVFTESLKGTYGIDITNSLEGK